MAILNEHLIAGDLRNLVKNVFEIDNFKSKVGDDEHVCVLSFTVESADPAKDLEHFLEMGYSFVLDADVSPGEMDDGKYKVYAELERGRHIGEQVAEIVEGVKKLTNLEELRFRYFKDFKSEAATLENLVAAIPQNKDEYSVATSKENLNNTDNFFSNSLADEVKVLDESITFKRIYSGPVSFTILESGPKEAVYQSVKGPIMLESKDMAEVMFLTKMIGNYNITKIGDTFIFENGPWAVSLKRKI